MLHELMLSGAVLAGYVLWRHSSALLARRELVDFVLKLDAEAYSERAMKLAGEAVIDGFDRFLMPKVAYSMISNFSRRKQVTTMVRKNWSDKEWDMLQGVFARMLVVNFKLAPLTFIISLLVLLVASLMKYAVAMLFLLGTFTAGQAMAMPNSPVKSMRNGIYHQAEQIASEGLCR